MAVLQMQRISICALKKDRKAILEKFQSMGVLEINQVLEDDEDFQKMDTMSARSGFDKTAQLADQALDILHQYAPEKTSLLSGLAGKELVDKAEYKKTADNKETIVSLANQLVTLNKEIVESKATILKLENQIESLTPWLSLDVPMNIEGTESTTMFVGTISSVMTLEQVYAVIAEQAPEIEAIDISIVSADRDLTYVTVICLKKEAQKVEDALRTGGFARPSQLVTTVPANMKKKLEEEIEKLNKEIQGIEQKIIGLKDKREDLRLISDYYRLRAEKYEVLGTLPQSQKTFVISGYIPEKIVPAVKKAFDEKYDCILDVEEIAEEEEAPVLLKNNGFSKSFEGVLSSYGLPVKGEIDPTTVMSFFYVFLFGLMLSDAAYGLIVFVACAVLLKKFPRMSDGMKSAISMFRNCGVSTLIWGILFGGYFGDVVTVVGKTFFHADVTIPALWFVPLDNPMKMLIYSMIFGVIHLFTGLAMKGYSLIKDKKYLDLFCDVVLWYVLLISLILMLIPSDIFASIAQAQITFPPVVVALSKYGAIAGAVGILLMSGRANKNVGLRIALGAYDLYNITGWLSDVLSYSRLLALGLATGVIASVVNQMGSMFGGSILGAIGFIIIFVIGHTFNMGINLLGAYVHTNRLQFVEFFGKFYEGGGRPFNPFKSNTKYVDVKEETYL